MRGATDVHHKRHQILRLPRKVRLQHHQMLHRPRKVTLELYQILHQPRKLKFRLHQILRLPRQVPLGLHQILRPPRKVILVRMRGGQYRGTTLRDARRNKERTYPELLRDRRCRLVVFGIEVGRRWSDEAATFLRLLAHTKARQAPALLRHSLTNALIHRWSAMLAHAAMHAFPASLLDQDLSGCHNLEGNTPSISEILAEIPPPPLYSRLPAPS